MNSFYDFYNTNRLSLSKGYRLLCVTLLVFLNIFVLAGCGNNGRSPVCAEVNGKKIFVSDLEKELQKTNLDPDEVPIESEDQMKLLKKEILLQMIDKVLLVQEAKARGIRVNDTDIESYLKDLSKADNNSDIPLNGMPVKLINIEERGLIFESLMIKRLIQSAIEPRIRISEEEKRNYFLTHKQEFEKERQYHARQIVTESETEARQVLDRIKNGEDFAELAREYSLSPDRLKGGDLGFFELGKMPPEFDEAVVSLKVKEVSEVIQSDYGYHIFQLLDVREPAKVEWDDVRPKVEKIIFAEKREKLFHSFLKELREKGKIKIYMNVEANVD